MTESPSNTYPYTLEVAPHPRGEGTWQWAIRKLAKLVQRSDRALASETKADAQGNRDDREDATQRWRDPLLKRPYLIRLA